jgi:hypothetical protein
MDRAFAAYDCIVDAAGDGFGGFAATAVWRRGRAGDYAAYLYVSCRRRCAAGQRKGRPEAVKTGKKLPKGLFFLDGIKKVTYNKQRNDTPADSAQAFFYGR